MKRSLVSLLLAPALGSLVLLGCDDGKKDGKPAAKAEARQAKAEVEAETKAKAEPEPEPPADAKAEAKAEAAETPENPEGTSEVRTPADADPQVLAAGAESGAPLSAVYWVTGDGGKSMVDIVGFRGADGDLVAKLAEDHGEPDGVDEQIPAGVPLPGGMMPGDEWLVISTDGEHRGKAVSFGSYGGASESHFIVVLDLEATGLAVRTEDWKGPVPRLRAAESMDTTKADGKALLDAMRPNIVAAAKGKASALLKRRKISPKHVEVVPGRFPRGFTHLVSLTVKARPDAEIFEEHVAGLLLADATGRVEAIIAPEMTIDTFDVHHLVDLEGDGQDEVLFDSSYYEGQYSMILAWDSAGAKVTRTLTGDGA